MNKLDLDDDIEFQEPAKLHPCQELVLAIIGSGLTENDERYLFGPGLKKHCDLLNMHPAEAIVLAYRRLAPNIQAKVYNRYRQQA